MTVGNFSPVLGSTGNDLKSASFFAEDNNNNLRADNFDIVYGLSGNDNLSTSDLDISTADFDFLVGGTGSDRYLVRQDSTVIVLDHGAPADNNTVIANGITADSIFYKVDNDRHLYIVDEASDTNLLLLDYQQPGNQVEFEFEKLTQAQIDAKIAAATDKTFTELQNGFKIPESGILNLPIGGLSAGSISADIQTIKDTATNYEQTIETVNRPDFTVEKSLNREDDSHVFRDREYYYDFYALDPTVFNPGSINIVSLTSEDFSPAITLLDSQGNILDFQRSVGRQNNIELAFFVGSGEPLFISAESRAAEQIGDYTLSVNRLNNDLFAGLANDDDLLIRSSTNVDDSAATILDTIGTRNTLTGELSTDDKRFIDGNDTFFEDNVLLIGGNPQSEISVTLDADFDARLFVDRIDSDGVRTQLAESDSANAAGIESTTFTLQDGFSYLFIIDTANAEVVGDYTLTTRVL